MPRPLKCELKREEGRGTLALATPERARPEVSLGVPVVPANRAQPCGQHLGNQAKASTGAGRRPMLLLTAVAGRRSTTARRLTQCPGLFINWVSEKRQPARAFLPLTKAEGGLRRIARWPIETTKIQGHSQGD